MAYDQDLATRVRAALGERRDVIEKAMFGGIAFMVRGHMTVGLVNDDLVVRVDPADNDRLVAEPHARPMDFTGRPMRGWLYVEPEGVRTPRMLTTWIRRALAYTDAKPVGAAGRPRNARPSATTARPRSRPVATRRAQK